MRLTVFAATLAFLLWGTPAFAGTAPDYDSDGVGDQIDNCSEDVNTGQDDTDVDDCGNICDADYDDTGSWDFPDFGEFVAAFNHGHGKMPRRADSRLHRGFPGLRFLRGDVRHRPRAFGNDVRNDGLPVGS